MQYHDFLGQVQNRARLSSTADAEIATRATLTTLAERLAGGEPKDLASQLPEPLDQYLTGAGAGKGESFSLKEFFQRVSTKTKADEPQAVYQARVVIEVLSEAVSPGQMKDIRTQLTDDYAPLFEKGAQGHL